VHTDTTTLNSSLKKTQKNLHLKYELPEISSTIELKKVYPSIYKLFIYYFVK